MNNLKKGDLVYWLFGETPKYKIVGTKDEPFKRGNGEIVNVSEGNDYIIVNEPLLKEGRSVFQHVPAQHLELIKD